MADNFNGFNMPAPEMLEVSPINAFAERFTSELDAYVRDALPQTMTNDEYGRATAAMLLALNRTLATCSVAFGKTHGVDRKRIETHMLINFRDNLTMAYEAADQGQATVQ